MTNAHFLRRALVADSLISTASGLIFIFAAAPVAAFMGIADPLVATLLGIGMAIYGVLVGRESRQTLTSMTGYVIGTLNLIFVILCALILVADAFGLTTSGRWAILMGADIVLVLAVLQYIGGRRINAAVRAQA